MPLQSPEIHGKPARAWIRPHQERDLADGFVSPAAQTRLSGAGAHSL